MVPSFQSSLSLAAKKPDLAASRPLYTLNSFLSSPTKTLIRPLCTYLRALAEHINHRFCYGLTQLATGFSSRVWSYLIRCSEEMWSRPESPEPCCLSYLYGSRRRWKLDRFVDTFLFEKVESDGSCGRTQRLLMPRLRAFCGPKVQSCIVRDIVCCIEVQWCHYFESSWAV